MPNSMYQQVLIFAGLHVVSSDFLDESPSSGGRLIHKVGVRSVQICIGPQKGVLDPQVSSPLKFAVFKNYLFWEYSKKLCVY